MPSSSLHGWLDAIQRGQLHGGPQLAPGLPTPSIDELLEVQETYAAMTGERLPLDWLTKTLKPTALAVVPPAAVSATSTGWRSWWPRFQQTLHRTPKAPAPLGFVEWQLVRGRWHRRMMVFSGNAVAVVAAGIFLDFLGHHQGTWHAISNVVMNVAMALAAGAAFSAVARWWYEPVRHISKLRDALWARSPLAQSYLSARAKHSPLPLLIRDQFHLDRLCKADGLFLPQDSEVAQPLKAPAKGKSS